LFCYSTQGASILAGKEGKDEESFGNALGYIFQLTDDLLDDDDAFSILKIMTKEEAENLLEEKKKYALSLAEKIDKSGFLTELVKKVTERKY
jgi:geranylgeranyl pyrophosphate synthase